MSYLNMDIFHNIANDPFAGTTDAISEYFHIQSVTEAGTYLDITLPTDNYPVNTPTRTFLHLPHKIDVSDLGASRPIAIVGSVTGSFSRVTASPSAGEFRVSPSGSVYRNIVEINSANAGETISYDYYGTGSLLHADLMNQLRFNTATITANYAITDTDGNKRILCSTSGVGNITVTLPTVADNPNREITIYKDHDNGLVTVDGEGAEKIGALSSEYLFSAWDSITVISDGTQWVVKSMSSRIDTDWISRSDWTNVHIGIVDLDYDNLSSSFTLGERVTGGTSGHYGIIMKDTGTTLTLRNVVLDSANIFENNEEITGSISGETADVNEGAGGASGAKNLDSNYYHGYGIDPELYKLKIFYNTSRAMTAASQISFSAGQNASYGMILTQVDTNNMKIQSGSAGFYLMGDAGTSAAIAANDSYYRAIWERRI